METLLRTLPSQFKGGKIDSPAFDRFPPSFQIIASPEVCGFQGIEVPLNETGPIQYADFAAIAEELAPEFQLPSPEWPRAEGHPLHRSWFASPLPSLRAVLL